MAEKSRKHWLEPPTWWTRWRPLRWVAVFVIVGVFASAFMGTSKIIEVRSEPHPETAAFQQRLSPAVNIASEFLSYQNTESVIAALEKRGIGYGESTIRLPEDYRYPPRTISTLTINDFQLLGTVGILNLEFFNDRLYEANFNPADLSVARSKLFSSTDGLKRDRNGRATLVDGNLRLSTNLDLVSSDVGKSVGATPYIIWQDIRLRRQLDTWDARFGSIALKNKS